MTVAVGADHRGFRLKQALKKYLERRGHEVLDMGTDSAETTDYPAIALRVAESVARKRARRGILVCGTGIGMSMTANRLGGIRAALVCSERTARLSRLHNDANVLCLGGDMLDAAKAKRIVGVWLGTRFAGGRHRRRIAELERIAARGCGRRGIC